MPPEPLLSIFAAFAGAAAADFSAFAAFFELRKIACCRQLPPPSAAGFSAFALFQPADIRCARAALFRDAAAFAPMADRLSPLRPLRRSEILMTPAFSAAMPIA